MKFELLNGRFFSREFATDSMAAVINEAAVKEYGFENADGQLSNPQSKDVSSAISDQFMKIPDSISEELPFS